jgi:hypothetical protein
VLQKLLQFGVTVTGVEETHADHAVEEIIPQQTPQPCWTSPFFVVPHYRPAPLLNRYHSFPLPPALFLLHRQPTTRKGNDDGENQERPEAELKSPAENQGNDIPDGHQQQRRQDHCHGNEDGVAFMPSRPTKPVRQPEQSFDGQ